VARARAERQLILLSAGTIVRRRALREHAQALAAEVDWSHMTAALRERRLLSTLGPRIMELAGGQAGDGFSSEVEQALASARRHGSFLHLLTGRVMSALAEAGIRCTALKGAALGELLYGDVGRRVSGDIDLLVAAEQLPAAVWIVRTLGYRPPTDPVDEQGLPRLHFVLAHEREELPPIELHWRIHWYERTFATERLLPGRPTAAPGLWRPAPAAELAALLLFYARDGFIGLRIAADLAAWWDRYGGALRPGALNDLLMVHPALAHVLRAAIAAAETTVGLPAPLILGDTYEVSLRGRAAARLANPNPRLSPSQLYAEMGLIDGLVTPPGGLRGFLRRQLLLPREVLDQRARRAPDRRTRTWLAYVARLTVRCGVLARYGLAVARIARGPETLRPGQATPAVPPGCLPPPAPISTPRSTPGARLP
jgi:hypothetical protein